MAIAVTTRRRAARRGRLRRGAVIHAVLIVGSLVMAFPFVYGVLSGLSSFRDFYTSTLLPIPSPPQWANIQAAFNVAGLSTMYINTTIRALWYGFWPTFLALLAGYAFARLRFPGRRLFFLLLLTGLMIPSQVTSVPIFIAFAHFPLVGGNDITGSGGHGLINTWGPLLLLDLISGFETFLVKQAVQMLPSDYEDSARVDGAGTLRIIFSIYAPMLKPVLATLTVINMIAAWNDYWTPLIYTNGGRLNTVSLGATNFVGSQLANGEPNYPLLFMASMIAILPTIVIFMFFQRYLVQGFALTGLK